MKLGTIILGEVSQKERQTPRDVTSTWHAQCAAVHLSVKQRQAHTHRGRSCGGRGGGGEAAARGWGEQVRASVRGM